MKLDEIVDLNKKPKVFLGGTCNNSKWRDSIIELLDMDYFNPVVGDWTEEAQQEEIKQRETCDYCLYVITPKMTGVYSIAEVVQDSNIRPNKTVFCVLAKDDESQFDNAQLKSLGMVKEMVRKNGAMVFDDLPQVAKFLNKGN